MQNKTILSNSSKYAKRGVSAQKEDVHAAIKGMDKGLFPNAFCKILPDTVSADNAYCNVMHADTAGTKTSLAYQYWKETGDLSVWEGIVQDALVMNLDDMACVGILDDFVVSSTVARNKNVISGDVIATIIQSAQRFANKMKEYDINIHMAGGETADVGDIVRTIDVGYTAFARTKRSDLIVNDIHPGQVIVGVASYGQSTYESEFNSGMGCNGLTSARHDVFDKYLAEKYPEGFDPKVPNDLVYSGSYQLTDEIDNYPLNAGKMVLSTTRTYLPVLKRIIPLYKNSIHGMIHNTGGALTKVMHFIDTPMHVIKDHLLPLPKLFEIIQHESGADWKEMYQVFNCGQRLEIYCDKEVANSIIEDIQSFNIDAQVIGRVEACSEKHLTISSQFGAFEYKT